MRRWWMEMGDVVLEVGVLVDGWVAEAHHHAGLAVAAAGGGEEGERERDEMCQARRELRLR